MSNDNEQLSQEEVDALFQQATGKNVAREQSRPGPIPPEQRAQPEQASAAPAETQQTVEPPHPTPTTRAAPTAPVNPQSPGSNGSNGAGLEEMRRLAAEIHRNVAGLESRIGRLETMISQQKQSRGGNASPQVAKLAQEVSSIKKEMHTLKAGVKSTPSYRLQKDFKCDSCGSHGAVATLHRCTSCGQQGWFGWWPSHKDEE